MPIIVAVACEECPSGIVEGFSEGFLAKVVSMGWEVEGPRIRCPQCVSKGPPKPVALLEAERVAQSARFESSWRLLGL